MKPTLHRRTPTSATTPVKEAVGTATSVVDVTPSNELFGSRRELVIEHAGFLYRLRITQNNKLILTK